MVLAPALPGSGIAPRAPRTWGPQVAVVPALVAAGSGALAWWLSSLKLDAIERQTINEPYLLRHIEQHLELTVLSTAAVIAVAVPLGVLLTRSRFRWASPGIIGLANVGQATPPVGLIVLLSLWVGGVIETSLGRRRVSAAQPRRLSQPEEGSR